jgi:hypothetical protein
MESEDGRVDQIVQQIISLVVVNAKTLFLNE